MGKFNKTVNTDDLDESVNSGVDWQQLIANFQTLSVEDALKNIMAKLVDSEKVEFDQICLILKHYLLLDDNKSYLEHFISHDSNFYLNMLLDRFNLSRDSPNVQWMITELLKVVTSICDTTQAFCLLKSQQFQAIICNNLFDQSILSKLKIHNGMSNTEVAILTNLFETLSNLCEVHAPLINFATAQHLEWISAAILNPQIHQEFVIAMARLMHLFSEKSDVDQNNNVNNLNKLLLDLYIGANFLPTAMNHLSTTLPEDKAPTPENLVANNLNAKLYLIVSFTNAVVAMDKNIMELDQSKTLLKMFEEYGLCFEYSLGMKLREENSKPSNTEECTEMGAEESGQEKNDDSDELRILIKQLETKIECKLLTIEVFKLIGSFYSKEEQYDDTENDYEEVESDDEMTQGNMETEVLQNSELAETTDVSTLKQLLKNFNLMKLFIRSITDDNEDIFQEDDKISHIFDSINLIRLEALTVYSVFRQNLYLGNDLNKQDMASDTLEILKFMKEKTLVIDTENSKQNLLDKLVTIVHDMYADFGSSISDEAIKMLIVEYIKDIMLKYKTESAELCVKFARVLTLLAINERQTNIVQGYRLIELSGNILLELTSATFEVMDQSKIETLVLNSELLDLLIDLFGDDNLKALEDALNFKQRIKSFSEQFYYKYKIQAKSRKLKKDNCLIIKTVRDNLKSFVEYKINN